jgi:polar amino acid transport system substrate-binding protein
MIKPKKILSLVVLVALAVTTFVGCSKQAEDNSSSQNEQSSEIVVSSETEKPFEGEKLTLAINATFAPFESVKINEGGESEFEGIDIDIANKLAEKLGFEMEITDMAFSGLIGALTSNRADFVISGISPTEERLKNVDFTTSYFFPSVAIISLKENAINEESELAGKKVAVPFGTTYEIKAKSIEGTEVVSIDGTPAVIQELNNKRVDAAIIDGCQAAEFVKQNPDLQYSLFPVERVIEESFAIATPKDSELLSSLDEALKEMMENGELDEIIAKWLGEEYLEEYKLGE